MRIVHIDETFHPAFGYQCNPLAKFQSMQGNDVWIVTVDANHLYPVYQSFGERGERIDEQDAEYEMSTGVHVVRVPGYGYVANRLIYNYRLLFRIIDQLHPDAMMVHCFETLTAMVVMARYRKQYPIVFDSHMLSMASKNRFAKAYEWVMRRFVAPIVSREGLRVIKTQDDDYVTTHLGIPQEQTRYISFGTDTDLFKPNYSAHDSFLDEKGLAHNSFVVVSTGKLSSDKGGMLLADAALDSFELERPIVFVIVASLVGDYEAEVAKKLKSSGNCVLFFPVQDYTKLPYFYQIADTVVFPKQCSMSFFDAQACGVPVISEDNGINVERNSHNNGICFESDSADSLRAAILALATMDEMSYKHMRQCARDYVMKQFSYDKIALQYTEELVRARSAFTTSH